MHSKIVLAGVAAAILAVAPGCLPSTKSGRGFHMPSGDAAKGQAAFVQLKCTGCHRVEGILLPPPAEKPEMAVVLGGEVTHVRTYGELVTAIIHPARDISKELAAALPRGTTKSPMKEMNREMTVGQLIDIVTFLEPTYRKYVPTYHQGPYD